MSFASEGGNVPRTISRISKRKRHILQLDFGILLDTKDLLLDILLTNKSIHDTRQCCPGAWAE
jgi:hypothetical protein